MNFKRPNASQLVQMLDVMFDFSTAVAEVDRSNADAMNYSAIYVNDNGEKVATCRCALPTAAALGCAFEMINPSSASRMVEETHLDPAVGDNLYEIMNIFSSLFMDDETSHLKLSEVVVNSDLMPQESQWSVASFSLQLGQYGHGQLVFSQCSSNVG